LEDGHTIAENLTFEITVEEGDVVMPVETAAAALDAYSVRVLDRLWC
jgi:hypothetical protein